MVSKVLTLSLPETSRPRQRARVPVRWSGPALIQQGDWRQAAAAAERVLRREPMHLGALEVQAQAALGEGRYEDVLRTVRHLMRLNSKESGYDLLRGMALQGLGRLEEALEVFARVLSDSKNPSIRAKVEREMELLLAWGVATPDPFSPAVARRRAWREAMQTVS